jgi:cytochrome c551/c552
MKVSKGGSGKWTSITMPPNDPNGTNQVEIRQLVKFVLGLAK